MSIKAKFIRSSLWMTFGAVVTHLSSTLVFIALARLLTPAQFGVVAFAAIFIDILRVIAAGGVVDILVQRSDWDEATASTAFWANLGASLALALLVGGVAAPLSYHLYDPTFGLVLAALAPLPIVDGLTSIHVARLKRDFGYKTIAARGALLALLSGLIGIGLALAGWGVWALVASKLLGTALASGLLWLSCRWRPRRVFDRARLRTIAGPSLHLLGSQLAAQFNAQVVGMMIGAGLGPAAMGQYRVGTRLLTLLSQILIIPLQSTAISAFSMVRDRDGAIAPAYLRMTRACALVAGPAYLGLAATGVDVVRLLFGPQWGAAGIIVSLNGLVVGAAVIMYFFGPAMTAAGRADTVMRTWVAALAGNVLTAAAALPFGLVPVVGAQVLRPYLTLPLAFRLLRTGIDLGARRLLGSLAPPLGAAGLMALALFLGGQTLLAGLAPVPRLAIQVALGPPLYLLLLHMLDRRAIGEVRAELAPLLARLRPARP